MAGTGCEEDDKIRPLSMVVSGRGEERTLGIRMKG